MSTKKTSNPVGRPRLVDGSRMRSRGWAVDAATIARLESIRDIVRNSSAEVRASTIGESSLVRRSVALAKHLLETGQVSAGEFLALAK